jgi:hypothetical protein
MISAGIATDKMRLLRDQSTENISVKQFIQKFDLQRREVQEIMDRLGREEDY